MPGCMCACFKSFMGVCVFDFDFKIEFEKICKGCKQSILFELVKFNFKRRDCICTLQMCHYWRVHITNHPPYFMPSLSISNGSMPFKIDTVFVWSSFIPHIDIFYDADADTYLETIFLFIKNVHICHFWLGTAKKSQEVDSFTHITGFLP